MDARRSEWNSDCVFINGFENLISKKEKIRNDYTVIMKPEIGGLCVDTEQLPLACLSMHPIRALDPSESERVFSIRR